MISHLMLVIQVHKLTLYYPVFPMISLFLLLQISLKNVTIPNQINHTISHAKMGLNVKTNVNITIEKGKAILWTSPISISMYFHRPARTPKMILPTRLNFEIFNRKTLNHIGLFLTVLRNKTNDVTRVWYPASACEMVMWSQSQTGGFPPVSSHTKTIRTQTSVVPTSMMYISCITWLVIVVK